eukprot:GHUV01046735.1.p1 GENE.GHUV01046735.1~~GHUV01046735.1.p1  ORF type:complete len:123 (-),score=33.64 GHUV01046735.1:48-416(-)
MGAAAAVLLGRRARGAAALPLTIASDKSGVGHTEPAAGMSGAVHAIMAASMQLAPPVLHLRSLNPYLLGTLGAGDIAPTLSIPRQSRAALRGSTMGSHHGHSSVTGVSSFAFQVNGLTQSQQ